MTDSSRINITDSRTYHKYSRISHTCKLSSTGEDADMRLIVKPDDFAEWFNKTIPGASRSIGVEDVQDMTTCGLIGRYGYFINLDLETVRCVLLYEQLRQNRQKKDEIRDKNGSIHCRRCGGVLAKPDGRKGRPNEFCDKCQPFRGRERNRKWRRKVKAARN